MKFSSKSSIFSFDTMYIFLCIKNKHRILLENILRIFAEANHPREVPTLLMYTPRALVEALNMVMRSNRKMFEILYVQ